MPTHWSTAYSEPIARRVPHSCRVALSVDLVLENILSQLAKDYNGTRAVFAACLVNRFWCTKGMPVLWHDPRWEDPRAAPKIILTLIKFVDDVDLDEFKCTELRLATAPAFYYPRYIKHLDMQWLWWTVYSWSMKYLPDCATDQKTTAFITMLVNSLFRSGTCLDGITFNGYEAPFLGHIPKMLSQIKQLDFYSLPRHSDFQDGLFVHCKQLSRISLSAKSLSTHDILFDASTIGKLVQSQQALKHFYWGAFGLANDVFIPVLSGVCTCTATLTTLDLAQVGCYRKLPFETLREFRKLRFLRFWNCFLLEAFDLKTCELPQYLEQLVISARSEDEFVRWATCVKHSKTNIDVSIVVKRVK